MLRTPVILVLLLFAAAAQAPAQIIDVRQGTNISVAASPDADTLVVDLLGGLWRLPSSGGGATMLMAPGSGIAQPRFDSSGARVVVERRQGDQWDLWLLDVPSGTWRQLTDTPYAERFPDFLADGSGVVFSSDRTGRAQLWALDLRNDSLRQLTDEPGASSFPVVGTDGTIAYANNGPDGSTLRIYSGGLVGEPLVASEAIIDSPSWRPDSPVLVYNTRERRRSDLELLIDADIDIRRPLTEGEDVFVGRVAWLGPGAFVYAADGQLWRRGVASRERRPVHLVPAGSIENRTTPGFGAPLDDAGPHPAHGVRDFVRSADGRSALFTALGDLWRLRGRALERLTEDESVDVEGRFVPGSDAVVFVSDRAGRFDLWHLQPDTHALVRLTDATGDASQPLLTDDGATAYFLSTTGHGPRAVTHVKKVDLDGSSPAQHVAGPFSAPLSLEQADGRLLLSGAAIDPADAAAVAGSIGAVLDPSGSAAPPAELYELDALQWSPQAPTEPFVVQAGRLFDGVGNAYRRHVDIHVTGQRITAIVGRNRLPLPAEVFDFSEMTVVPGFVDVHAHHPRNAGRDIGLAWLRHGVTTVREVDADPAAALERSEAWASGARPGPRLLISPQGGDAGAAATAAAEPIVVSGAFGVSSGFAHALNAAGPWAPDWRAPSLFHQPWQGSEMALSPLNTTYQDTLALLAGSGSFMSTGLSAALQTVVGPDDRRATLRQLGSLLERTQRSFGRVAVGSDAPLVPYGDGFQMELEALVRAGVPNAQVLRWATAGGAMALGLDTQLGSLESGRLADFVVIDGDPLLRIADARNIAAVVKGGVFVVDPEPGRIMPAGTADGPAAKSAQPY